MTAEYMTLQSTGNDIALIGSDSNSVKPVNCGIKPTLESISALLSETLRHDSNSASSILSSDKLTVTAAASGKYASGACDDNALMTGQNKYYWETTYFCAAGSVTANGNGMGYYNAARNYVGEDGRAIGLWNTGQVYRGASVVANIGNFGGQEINQRHYLDLVAGTYSIDNGATGEMSFTENNLNANELYRPLYSVSGNGYISYRFAKNDLLHQPPEEYKTLEIVDNTVQANYDAALIEYQTCIDAGGYDQLETCGTEPVNPGPVSAPDIAADGYFDIVQLEEYNRLRPYYTNDYSTADQINTNSGSYTVDLKLPDVLPESGLINMNAFFYNLNNQGSGNHQKRVRADGVDLTYPDERFQPGDIVRLSFSGSSKVAYIGTNLYDTGITQADVEEYNAALAAWETCMYGSCGSKPKAPIDNTAVIDDDLTYTAHDYSNGSPEYPNPEYTISDNGLTISIDQNIEYRVIVSVGEQFAVSGENGKYYWEVKVNQTSNGTTSAMGMGVYKVKKAYLGFSVDDYGLWNSGRYYHNGIYRNETGHQTGDVVRHFLDLEAGTYTVEIIRGDDVYTELVASSLQRESDKKYRPAFVVSFNTSYTLRTAINDFEYDMPDGYQTLGNAPTQQQIDEYDTALITWQACIDAQDTDDTGGSFALVTNNEGLAEKLQQMLRLQAGSCLYDLTAGFAWHKLLGSTNPIHYATRIRKKLNENPFVEKVQSINVDFNSPTRTANIEFTVLTTLGKSVTVTFNTAD